MLGLVLAGLVIMSSSLLAGLFWQFFAPVEDAPLVATPLMKKNKTTTEPVINYGIKIANLHLFGKEERKSVIVKPQTQVTKRSRPKPVKTKPPLNIILTGVLVRKTKPSFAIFQIEGKSKVHRVGGDKLQEGVKLIKIKTREVVLDYEGEKVTLKLPEKTLAKNKRVQKTQQQQPRLVRQRRPRNRPPASNHVPPEPNNGLPPLATDNLSQLRNTLLSEPHRAAELVSIKVAKDKDQNLIGYRLSPGKNRAFFRELGLRPGDIAIEINGISLNDPMNGLKVMGDVSSASSLTLKVKRGNQTLTINRDL
ncbi:MAG: type II secretion system protein GspC [Thiotrichaceae bacterium]|nr:type II secretion system protein GspC [Thiotrichaceae bacterium]